MNREADKLGRLTKVTATLPGAVPDGLLIVAELQQWGAKAPCADIAEAA